MPNSSKGDNKGSRRDDKSENSSKRGFGATDEEKQKETTGKGGKTSNEKNPGRESMPEENRGTGKKGSR